MAITLHYSQRRAQALSRADQSLDVLRLFSLLPTTFFSSFFAARLGFLFTMSGVVYSIPATAFSTFWNGAAAEIVCTFTEILFYGIFVVLFAFAINLLIGRHATGQERSSILIGATLVMLVMASVQMFFRLGGAYTATELLYVRVAQGQGRAVNNVHDQNVLWNFLEDVSLVTNNLVTDGVLIYRCFLIWGRNYYVIAAPSIMLLLTTILSYLSAVQGDYPQPGGPTVDLRIGFLLGVLTNLVLVGLTAGRILFTRHRARQLGIQADVVRKYNNATAMILESGAIISVWTVIYVILRSMNVPDTVWRAFRGGLPQLLNIVPTLIIVRVGLGHAIDARTTTSGTMVSTWKTKGSTSAAV
ncbi:hypothetical protein MIND_00551700 [Mycena indigotica]|uniref:Uncharacterized protein n=1 Tax=Mycena indigotica TaxID=2126181 RepID=A0A8H6WCN9_9AGAR|nr:uncharacterized protein MIND_00551700 [Mycena indigotica]KAF7307569.1 hypothetical protein MIND_00551700 [Mycena indigotica]